MTDLSRQTIAGRASFRVDPAPWYVGLRRPAYFADVKTGVDTEVVAVDLAGQARGRTSPSSVVLTQVQWHSVRRAEGQGFYTWETERKETEAGRWDGHHHRHPRAAARARGERRLLRPARDGEGRGGPRPRPARRPSTSLGPGYTAWERYDHNRIDLVPEKKTYRPGRDGAAHDQVALGEARSPSSPRSAKACAPTARFALASTQETVDGAHHARRTSRTSTSRWSW